MKCSDIFSCEVLERASRSMRLGLPKDPRVCGIQCDAQERNVFASEPRRLFPKVAVAKEAGHGDRVPQTVKLIRNQPMLRLPACVPKRQRTCKQPLREIDRLHYNGGRVRALLHRDSLDDVARHTAFATVIQSSRPWIGVAGQVLHAFQGDALLQEVGGRCHAKRMRRHQSWRPLLCRWYTSKIEPSFADMLATLRRLSIGQQVLTLALAGPGSRKIQQLLENTVALPT